MPKLVVDSWAWIEYLDGSEAGKIVNKLISGNSEVWTSAISLAEVVSKYRRKGRSEATAVEAIGSLSRVEAARAEDAVEAGGIHAEQKKSTPNFGLSDAFVLQLARRVGGKVVTGDADFAGIDEVEFLR